MKGYTIQHSIELLEKQAGSGSGGGTTASNVSYDNTSSGLTANNVQKAVDELNAKVIGYGSKITASADELAAFAAVNDTYVAPETGLMIFTAGPTDTNLGRFFVSGNVGGGAITQGGYGVTVTLPVVKGETITLTAITSNMGIESIITMPFILTTPPTANTRKSKKK